MRVLRPQQRFGFVCSTWTAAAATAAVAVILATTDTNGVFISAANTHTDANIDANTPVNVNVNVDIAIGTNTNGNYQIDIDDGIDKYDDNYDKSLGLNLKYPSIPDDISMEHDEEYRRDVLSSISSRTVTTTTLLHDIPPHLEHEYEYESLPDELEEMEMMERRVNVSRERNEKRAKHDLPSKHIHSASSVEIRTVLRQGKCEKSSGEVLLQQKN
eukprot:CAMPEP_0204639538 /NCGR_PEP_ID=MMETSP0717-20131115/43304_1 /ASSEMBLY_ACC=CAM_ASM_000666 /TAXON_ID=230516 /ORGANISM="Chaetoceros curvisetus" /LENGTH=214 /DNA_ID=CAMNT_0051659659 /DNA_START=431 /DNA_END=1072 /DNA_ORIENTATION=+